MWSSSRRGKVAKLSYRKSIDCGDDDEAKQQGCGSEEEEDKSAWDKANCLSRYFLFDFMIPVLKLGYRNQLTLDNVDRAPRRERSRRLGGQLQRCYTTRRLERGDNSFLGALVQVFGPQLFYVGLLDCLVQLVGQPMITVSLGWIVRDSSVYLKLKAAEDNESGASKLNEAYWRVVHDALYLMLFEAITILLLNPAFMRSYQIGLRIRAATCRMLYRKSLKLSQAALQESRVGQMVNLLSNDVNRFEEIAIYLAHMVMMPLQALIILILLATVYLGWLPTLAILVAILVYLVLQSAMGYGFGVFRDKTAQLTDERVRLVNEVVKSMQIIKMYAWEKPFKLLLEAARRREMAMIGKSSLLKVLNQALFMISCKGIIFIGLETYVWLDNQLEPEIVFVTMGLAYTVSVCMTLLFPMAVSYTAEASISCSRINQFLLLAEQKQQLANYKHSEDVGGSYLNYSISMQNVTCQWSSNQADDAILRNVSLAVKPQELVLVVGRVGSGKSSALLALLGELPVSSGLLEVNGTISYASQDSWIFSGSVRDNILFGKPYEAKRYKEVLKVCSLERDLEILMDGDATLVGERGTSLSGGQKGRVNLARALYAEADIYILDDPLSAVDAPVARHIFNKCLRTFLRKKTIILATHQLQFLRYANKVLVVDRERPAAFGDLEDLVKSDAFKLINYSRHTFEAALIAQRQNMTQDDDDELTPPATPSESLDVPDKVKETSPLAVHWTPRRSVLQVNEEQIKMHRTDRTRRNSEAETLTCVSANWSTCLFYIRRAAGPCALLFYALTLMGSEAVYQYIDLFLSLWSDSVSRADVGSNAPNDRSWLDGLSLGEISVVYLSLVLISLLFGFVQTSLAFWGAFRASKRLHRKLLDSVVAAPMKFFSMTPVGVLLNRFSRDMGFVDEQLPSHMVQIIHLLLNSGAIMVVTSFLNYLNLIALAVLVGFTWLLHHLCATTIKKLKQIEGIKRSPIFSHVSTTAAGLATVRAFKVQRDFMGLFDKYQDSQTGAWLSYTCASRWFMVHLDLLRLVFIGLVVVVLLTSALGSLNASLIGLLLSLVTTLPAPLQYVMNKLVDVEGQMTSVQRIKEFSELAPEEAECNREDEISSALGQVGDIKFKRVSLKYFEDEPVVLKRISFHIKSGEKVGVVGRTGAGKSSIVSALFRLYHFDGLVEVDGVDTKQVPLASLRRVLSIIPQDPVLFSCSIRKNLDPFEEFKDEDIWAALDAVQLKWLVMKSEKRLELMVNEGGANFSVGQRQLLCLARAILRRNKILILDEATANVDPETDSFIQKTIADQFAHCTVITIAHRLITIANSDRILVLDHGQVKEFGAPKELIKDESSLFAQMVNSSAQEQADAIKRLIERY